MHKVKTTYKLLGLVWDKKEIVQTKFEIFKHDFSILDFRYDDELFDVNECIRKIAISELLNANEEKDVIEITNKLKRCCKILVVIDWLPNVRNLILQRFAKKRILQVLNYLSKSIPSAKIYADRKF